MLLLEAASSEPLVEAIDPAAGIDNLLLSGEERMALTAYIQENVVTNGGAGFNFITAAAASGNGLVTRMRVGFHVWLPAPRTEGRVKKEGEGYQNPKLFQGPQAPPQ